ncbi:MAG: hypothetical protein ACE5FQ_08955 [Thiogranum sp.]
MRLLGRLVILLLLLAVLSPLLRYIPDVPLPQPQPLPQDERLQQSTAAIVYRLQRNDWLTFELPLSGEPLYRVLTNADVDKAADETTAPWGYAIEYRILDESDTVLELRSYYHRTRVSRTVDANGQPADVPAFYLDGNENPADGRIMLLRMDEFPTATRIQLRLHQASAPIRGAMLRLYQRERIPDHKLTHRWNRINENKKARLSRGNVYGKEWLTPREQRALLRYRWVPLAPQGITGDDELRRVLYVLGDGDSVQPSQSVLPEGLLVEPGHNGTLPVPLHGGTLRMALHRIDNRSGGALVLRWQGESDRSRFERRISFADIEAGHTLTLPAAGLLDISSDQSVIINAELAQPDGTRLDITPETAFLRTYRADARQWVDYPVVHIGKRRTPLRIDFRALMTWPGATSLTLTYQLLNSAGENTFEGNCKGESAASLYDRLYGETDAFTLVSDSLSCYLHVAANVDTVRVRLSAPGLVAGYSVPPDLVTRVRVPQDYYSYDPEQRRLPGWYGIAPANEEQLIRGLRMQRLVWQQRPAEDDPEVLAGRYLWEEFHPRGNWRARYLLNPRDDQLPLPDRALKAVFHEIGNDTTLPVTLVAEPGKRAVRPRLSFLRDSAAPLGVQLFLNDRLLLERAIRGRRGELRLPDMPAGEHRLRIVSDTPVRWFMNRIRTDSPTWIKRLAVRIDQRPQSFVYRKQQHDEVLTGHLQVPRDRKTPIRLRVRISGPRRGGIIAADGWSLTDRVFLVEPDNSEEIPVLNSRTETVDKGQRIYIPLRSDLAAGDYRISVWLEDADARAYLSLYRLTPGLHERRQMFRERAAGSSNGPG